MKIKCHCAHATNISPDQSILKIMKVMQQKMHFAINKLRQQQTYKQSGNQIKTFKK